LPLASVPSEIRDASIVLISCEQRTGGTKHPRSFGRGDKVYDPWHYVPVLALVDVAVVYKVDRRTRALADFAKIVEVFDRQGVCFVSVTQQFNTATSMGRRGFFGATREGGVGGASASPVVENVPNFFRQPRGGCLHEGVHRLGVHVSLSRNELGLG
jgi:Resolvase, N terminal domain